MLRNARRGSRSGSASGAGVGEAGPDGRIETQGGGGAGRESARALGEGEAGVDEPGAGEAGDSDS